jgi:hypothetical protein
MAKTSIASEEGKATINVGAAVKAANLVKETLAALADKKQQLADEKRLMQERNNTLWDLPVTREEAKKFVLGSVDMMAAEFLRTARWEEVFRAFAFPKGRRQLRTGRSPDSHLIAHAGPLSLADIELAKGRSGNGASGTWDMLGIGELGFIKGAGESFVESAFCFFFADQVKDKIERNFDRMFPTFNAAKGGIYAGFTLEQRREEIDRNSARIDAIDEELGHVESQMTELAPLAKSPR